MYNLLPIWLIAVLVGLLLMACSEGAFYLGRRSPSPLAREPLDIALPPAFTLVALLLGFVFSMALARYEARGAAVLHEACGIRETWLLADVLEPEAATRLKHDLDQYRQARLEFAKADAQPQARAQAAQRSRLLHEQMWQLLGQARSPQSGDLSLLTAALAELNRLSAEEASVLSGYIPPAILVMLILLSALSSALLGLRMSCDTPARRSLATPCLAVMLALILGTMIDLDQPQRGFIRVSLEPLRSLSE